MKVLELSFISTRSFLSTEINTLSKKEDSLDNKIDTLLILLKEQPLPEKLRYFIIGQVLECNDQEAFEAILRYIMRNLD